MVPNKGAASEQEVVITQDPGGYFSATTYLWVLGCPPLPSVQVVLEWFHKLQGEKRLALTRDYLQLGRSGDLFKGTQIVMEFGFVRGNKVWA